MGRECDLGASQPGLSASLSGLPYPGRPSSRRPCSRMASSSAWSALTALSNSSAVATAGVTSACPSVSKVGRSRATWSCTTAPASSSWTRSRKAVVRFMAGLGASLPRTHLQARQNVDIARWTADLRLLNALSSRARAGAAPDRAKLSFGGNLVPHAALVGIAILRRQSRGCPARGLEVEARHLLGCRREPRQAEQEEGRCARHGRLHGVSLVPAGPPVEAAYPALGFLPAVVRSSVASGPRSSREKPRPVVLPRRAGPSCRRAVPMRIL